MIADTRAEIVAALEAAGLRVASRGADITPPVVYLRRGLYSDATGVLAGASLVTWYLHYIPVRGVDNPAGDDAAIDAMLAAVRPLAVAQVTGADTSVTVSNDTWPCWRTDLPVMALDPAEVS